MAKTIPIPQHITVGDLADRLQVPVTKLIMELMKNGVMATVNEKIDFETAQIVTGEVVEETELELEDSGADAVATSISREKRVVEGGVDRPPVVAVMGHVDHGKTSLLDAIREADQAAHEAGGITQHISAYQITHNDRKITFLDTPGHEAFAALREHGAQLTDLAIIVVAADDGVKPQTKEAIRFAQKAGVKMLVAINKTDKPGADVNRVKQELAEQNLLVEEWGGDLVVVEVSAKTKKGIDQLLDMVILMADVEELKADATVPGEGLVIESHMQTGRGPVATALVEHGTVKPGQLVVAGSTYAKLRTLEATDGTPLPEAGPSTPVVMTGFKQLPQFGDAFVVVANEKEARNQAAEYARTNGSSIQKLDMTSGDLINMINRDRDTKEVRVIIKADVQGSLTSVADSLKTLENEELKVRVVGSGVGPINESDVMMASTSQAIIYGFNVPLPVNVKQLAAREKVSVRAYKIIYELIDDVKELLTELLDPEIVETEQGRLIIKGVFRTTKETIICGGEVTKGKVTPGALAKVMRGDEELAEVSVLKVQRQQQEAKEVFEGEMCGLELTTTSKLLLEEGDKLEFFTRETVARTL